MQVDLSEPTESTRWWRWLPVWAGVTLVYAVAVHSQAGVGLRISLATSAYYFGVLALLMTPVSRLSQRLMTRRPPVPALIAAHLGVGTATILIWQACILTYYRLEIGPRYWDIVYARNWIFQLIFAVAIYGTALSVTLTAQAWRRERERERRETALIVAARDAELMALKAQFQPHFVLNALNSLLALIDVNPALARTMVVRLSDLMKAVFDRIDVPHVPLERELDLVRAYLDVERIRLGSRLSVSFDIDDAARGVMVPPFLLQPLVENAVKHGVAPFATPGSVHVTARVADGRVHVTVADSGRQPLALAGQDAASTSSTSGSASTSASASSTGRGLQITRQRLSTVYGTAYALTLDRNSSGMTVRLDLPVESAHVA